MLAKRLVATVLSFAFLSLETAYAQEDFLTLRWAELNAATAHKKVKLVLRNDVHLEGEVRSVQSDTLDMAVLKTSDKKGHPVGNISIPRHEVMELRIKEIKGPMRLIGAAGIGAAGSLIALNRALDESRPSNDAARMTAWGVTTIACVVGGFFLGRLADTHETQVKIAPE